MKKAKKNSTRHKIPCFSSFIINNDPRFHKEKHLRMLNSLFILGNEPADAEENIENFYPLLPTHKNTTKFTKIFQVCINFNFDHPRKSFAVSYSSCDRENRGKLCMCVYECVFIKKKQN